MTAKTERILFVVFMIVVSVAALLILFFVADAAINAVENAVTIESEHEDQYIRPSDRFQIISVRDDKDNHTIRYRMYDIDTNVEYEMVTEGSRAIHRVLIDDSGNLVIHHE